MSSFLKTQVTAAPGAWVRPWFTSDRWRDDAFSGGKPSKAFESAWEAAKVHPRDIRTLDDFRERVPFIDKDAVRRFRDERGDPYGGLLCVDPDDLTGVGSTSGTTGDPTLVPEMWGGGGLSAPSITTRDLWGWGERPGDFVMLVLFTFRGPTYGLFQHSLQTPPILLDFDPAEMERFCER